MSMPRSSASVELLDQTGKFVVRTENLRRAILQTRKQGYSIMGAFCPSREKVTLRVQALQITEAHEKVLYCRKISPSQRGNAVYQFSCLESS